MFSYSSNPIDKSSNIETTIDFITLIKKIKNPSKENVFPEIYRLRKEGKDAECKLLKSSKLPWVTPNCVVRKRSLKKEGMFNENFIRSSGYIYFDIDTLVENLSTDELKEDMIQKYGNIVALISKSSSNRGISILVRINSNINNEDDFYSVYDYITNTYFNGITFDDNVRTLGASWYVPLDESVFVNYENEIDISSILNNTKVSSDVLFSPPPNHIHRVNPSNDKVKCSQKHEYIELSTREVFETCNLETPVFIEDHFSISPTPILQIRFPKVIKDGSKRKVFRKIIHDFLELNPGFTISHAYLFIYHINENYAKPKMEPELLKKIVESQFEFIKSQENYINKSKRTLRSIHYKDKGLVPRNKKIMFSNRFRGIMERYQTFKMIQYSRNYLYDEHYTYTNQQIADLIGISLSTVKRHINNRKEDYEIEYLELKDEIEKVLNENNVDLLKLGLYT